MKRLRTVLIIPAFIGAGILGILFSASSLADGVEDSELAKKHRIDGAALVAECDTVVVQDTLQIITCTGVPTADRTMWGQDVTFGPDGYLYVGTYWDVGEGDFDAWYMIDVTTGAIVDSFGTGVGGWTSEEIAAITPPQGDTLIAPRGAAWKLAGATLATGDTMYTADFDGQVVKRWVWSGTGWDFASDFLKPGYAVHGVQVDPDGKVWVGFYAATDTLVVGEEKIEVGTLRCYNADGTEATFSPLNIIDFGAAGIDTITAYCRGMTSDQNGNIIFSGSGGKQLYRINYTDGSGMNKTVLEDAYLTKAGVDDAGYVYVAHVLSGNPITIFDSDFAIYGYVEDEMGFLSRSLQVSGDGQDVYVGAIYAGLNGVRVYHSDLGPDGVYTLTDTLGTIFHYATTVDTNILAVDDITGLPLEYTLAQNFPNPFNPRTWITYEIPKTEMVSLTIYNLLGQKVRTLVNDVQIAGAHSLIWEGTNDEGIRLPSGVYIYKLETSSITLSRKMVMMK